MEDPIKESLHLEFYGLPGCGKSTISHMVASKLKGDGMQIDEPSYEIDRNSGPLFRKIKKLSIYFYWFVFHNHTFKIVNAIVRRNGYSAIAKIEQMSNVLQKIGVYRKNGRNRIVIWDQGLVQASISLSLKGLVDANDNFKNLLRIINPDTEIKNVLISVDKMVALERMSRRTTNDSRVEKLKDEKQKHEMMICFQNEIDVINNNYDGIVVDGTIELEKQVDHIVNSLFCL